MPNKPKIINNIPPEFKNLSHIFDGGLLNLLTSGKFNTFVNAARSANLNNSPDKKAIIEKLLQSANTTHSDNITFQTTEQQRNTGTQTVPPQPFKNTKSHIFTTPPIKEDWRNKIFIALAVSALIAWLIYENLPQLSELENFINSL